MTGASSTRVGQEKRLTHLKKSLSHGLWIGPLRPCQVPLSHPSVSLELLASFFCSFSSWAEHSRSAQALGQCTFSRCLCSCRTNTALPSHTRKRKRRRMAEEDKKPVKKNDLISQFPSTTPKVARSASLRDPVPVALQKRKPVPVRNTLHSANKNRKLTLRESPT